jgi:hypothetical protein
MYVTAELVYKSYIPDELKKGMFFFNLLYPGTDKAQVEIFELQTIPNDIEACYVNNGYPLDFLIIEEGNLNSSEIIILATQDQIGWWDEGEDSEDLYEITLKELNMVFNDYNGYLNINIEGHTGEPEILEDKVILSYVMEYDDDEEDYEEEDYEEDDDEEYQSSFLYGVDNKQ